MTLQNIFDEAVTHLFEQGRPSTLPGSPSTCCYRGPDNLRCAVGLFIADDRYYKGLEGWPVTNPCVIHALPDHIQTDSTALELLQMLQQHGHDDAAPSYECDGPAEYRAQLAGNLRQIAHACGLNTDAIP